MDTLINVKGSLIEQYYTDGLSINSISNRLGLEESTVIEALRSFKVKEGRGYSHQFKEIVVDRLIAVGSKGQVKEELDVAYKTMSKYLEEFNIELTFDKSMMYTKIDWHRFDMCPDCGTRDVNDLNIYKEDNIKHSYCVECGTEWQKAGKSIVRVNFEYVD